MIVHTVICRLRRPVDDDARGAFVAALRSFGANPPHAEGPAVIGVDLGLRPEGRSVSEFSLEVRFADEHAFAAYLADPAHRALVADCFEPLLETWLSVQRAA
ncbi:hypothetical protein GCM10027416_01340 [Okibacterium endophyticum]